MARTPAQVSLTGTEAIRQGQAWSKAFQWIINGVAVDLAAVTAARFQARPDVFDDDTPTAAVIDLTLGAGITITDVVQAATAVTTAFAADGVIVASGAAYLDDFGQPTLKVRRTVTRPDGSTETAPGDDAVIAGSGTNDGTYEVLSVDSATQITVDATFNAEAAAGTVEVSRDGEVVMSLNDAATTALTFTNTLCGELELDFPNAGATAILDVVALELNKTKIG